MVKQIRSRWIMDVPLRRAVPIRNTHISQHIEHSSIARKFTENVTFFKMPKDADLDVVDYCDHLGKWDLGAIVNFVSSLERCLNSFPYKTIILMVDPGQQDLNKTVFLVGAYLILKLHQRAEFVSKCFDWIQDEPIACASSNHSGFSLQLLDCWRGLEKGVRSGWLRYSASGFIWGKVDIEEYLHYAQPANGDLHEIVPGKLIVLRAPRDLEHGDDATGGHVLGMNFCAATLRDFGANDAVWLDAAPSSPAAQAAFARCGIRCHSLGQGDALPISIGAALADLERVAAAARGAIAVCVRDGPGQDGTLIALHLMTSRGFAAREAVGWLRIVRPGLAAPGALECRRICEREGLRRHLAGEGSEESGSEPSDSD